MNYFLIVSYDGTDFNGWQAQKKTALRTVQETLCTAAKDVFQKDVVITASGRTDAGVHALCQVCSFSAETTVPPEKIADCFNMKLPADVRVLQSGVAEDAFDACRCAKRKTYMYSLYFSRRENPLKERYCVRVSGEPDFEKMMSAAKMLEGEHDFKAFCAANSAVKTTIRTVYSVRLRRENIFSGEELKIYVTGNGFLYNMVRTVAGTLLDIGFGRKTFEDLKDALQKGDRSKVGRTMPAKGLCLISVEYDKNFTEIS